MTPMLPPDEGAAASVLITLTRLEGKVDAALGVQTARLDEHARRLEDVEVRLRTQEATPSVRPAAMWTALGVLAAIVAAITPLLSRLYA